MVIHHVWHWILQVLGKTFPCFRKDKGKNLLWGILMQWQLVTQKEVIEHRIKRDLQDHQVQYQNFYTGKKMTLWFKSSMSDLWILIQWIPESALLWALITSLHDWDPADVGRPVLCVCEQEQQKTAKHSHKEEHPGIVVFRTSKRQICQWGLEFQGQKCQEKKSLNDEQKDMRGKRIPGKKMEKEDLLLWKRLFVAVEPAEVNVKSLRSV